MIIAAAVSVTACATSQHMSGASRGATASKADHLGIVTGTLRLVGGPPPGTDIPARGTVYAFTAPGLTPDQAVASVAARSDGRFELTLPAGSYLLAATSPRFSIDPTPATPPCTASEAIFVTEGSTAHADVSCPMK